MHLWVAVAHVRDIVDAVQVLVPGVVEQVAARAAHNVQRRVIVDCLRGTCSAHCLHGLCGGCLLHSPCMCHPQQRHLPDHDSPCATPPKDCTKLGLTTCPSHAPYIHIATLALQCCNMVYGAML